VESSKDQDGPRWRTKRWKEVDSEDQPKERQLVHRVIFVELELVVGTRARRTLWTRAGQSAA
jgi:hypothetical protein